MCPVTRGVYYCLHPVTAENHQHPCDPDEEKWMDEAVKQILLTGLSPITMVTGKIL